MIAIATRLSDAVYSTNIVGRSASGSSVSQRIIGCCGFGVTNDEQIDAARAAAPEDLRADESALGNAARTRPYNTGASGPTHASAAMTHAP